MVNLYLVTILGWLLPIRNALWVGFDTLGIGLTISIFNLSGKCSEVIEQLNIVNSVGKQTLLKQSPISLRQSMGVHLICVSVYLILVSKHHLQ